MRSKEQARVREHAGGKRDAAGYRSHSHSSTGTRRAQPKYGKVTRDVWRKTANATKHMLRAPKAWAVDSADLACVEALRVRYVQIHDLESLRQYWARPETLRLKGFVLERGAGKQVALSLEWWASTPYEADSVARGLQESEPEPVGVVQGALW